MGFLLANGEVLDDITLYWLTNNATSAARLYWENGGRGVTSPAAQKTAAISQTLCHVKLTDERRLERRSGGIGPLLSPNFIDEFADI